MEKNKNLIELGNPIRELRKSKGLPQEQLGGESLYGRK